MQKPNHLNEVQNHHYAAHFGARSLCAHTCQRDLPGIGKRAFSKVEHTIDVHGLMTELETLPDKARTIAIAESLIHELYRFSDLPGHIYAAIWAQLQEAFLA